MIIHTLSSDASVALELGQRIARTTIRRRSQRRSTLSAVWGLLFPQPAGKPVRARA